MNLEGKVAIVTGGAQGIGKGIVERYVKENAKVAIFDIDKDMLEATEAEMKSMGGDVITFTVDVLSKEQIFNAVNAVADKWGHIDILVNDAGICPWADFLEIPEEDWDKVMGINLKGYFLMSQAVGRIMSKQKDGGSIIHMSSVNGLAAEAQIAHYNVSKGGINMLTMSMALELAKYNIRVNAICPGFIDTRLNRSDIENEEWLKEYLKTIPMGRVGKPSDIASAAFFLASDDSAYITGHLLVVDGGQIIKLS
ncbi:MAG: SDR family NAD(P)-dependent oxidoreductase [Eubacteriales bacterium]|nr:SDR family NAD(P)-dependent oxidoreductase [Eubacteriales bacterium]MDY2934335.1 SDR family NAD(P)-dependent oxidoreductase [Anaerovoracaceae bacterium]